MASEDSSSRRQGRHCNEVRSLWLGDIFIVSFVLYPCMVFYWRGIWDLIGVYIYPDDELRKCWTIFGLGCGTIIGYATHPLVERALVGRHRVTRFVLTRVYMGVFAFFPMAYWRGVWTVVEYYLLEYGWKVALGKYVICEVLMHIFRVRQTAMFSPLFVEVDTRDDVLTPKTRFGVKPSLSWRYLLDSLFSNFVALTLSIVLWESAWTCVDAMFAHIDYSTSNFICFGAGYAAVLCVLLMDPVFLSVSRQIATRHASSSPRRRFLALLAWEDFVYFVAFWCHLFVWRGFWNINAEFIIADIELGGWVNNMLGTLGFLVFQVYSYVGFCGCVVDGWLDGTQDRVFNNYYLPIVRQYFTSSKKSNISDDDEDIKSVKDTLEDNGSTLSSGVYTVSHYRLDDAYHLTTLEPSNATKMDSSNAASLDLSNTAKLRPSTADTAAKLESVGVTAGYSNPGFVVHDERASPYGDFTHL